MDALVLGAALNTIALFILFHSILLIIFKESRLLFWTRSLYALALVNNVLLTEQWGWVVCLLSALLLTLMVYVYYVAIAHILFGTSTYAGLIMELDKKPSQTQEQVLTQYNARNILDSHLKQMLYSGVIRKAQNTYSLVPLSKPLFMIGSLQKGLRDLIDISVK